MLLLVGVVTLSGCKAPRTNPLDPESSIYTPPSAPSSINDLALDSLSGIRCLISWTSPERANEYALYYGDPDWQGLIDENATYYQGDIPGVKPAGSRQTIWLNMPSNQTLRWVLYSISDEGIISDASNILEIVTSFDEHPAEISASVNSFRQAHPSDPLGILRIIAEAVVQDEDSIDSVWIQKDSLIIGGLERQGFSANYMNYFSEIMLPDSSFENIESLIGHTLTVWCRDAMGYETVSSPLHLTRVIQSTPTAVFPIDVFLTDENSSLEWLFFNAEFRFTYSVEIVHIPWNRVPVVVFSQSNIHPDATSLEIDRTVLPSEIYYLLWTISVVDEFGNEARSSDTIFYNTP